MNRSLMISSMHTRFSMKRVLIALTLGGTVSVLMIVWLTYVFLFHTGVRRALPWNATEINEYYKDYGILPDYLLCLKAKIDERDFPAYSKRLHLKPYEEERYIPGTFGWDECDQSWWNPTHSMTGAHVEYLPEKEFSAQAKYENGFVYVVVSRW